MTRPGSLHVRRRVRNVALRVFARLPRRARVRVVHLIAPQFTVGALCVVEHDGAVLMLRQLHRHGWTLPGGLLDRGEAPHEAAARELAEETGLRADPGWPVATVVEPVTRRVDVLFHVEAAGRPRVRPRSEAVKAAWLRPQDAGDVDEPTRTALATLARVRAGVQPSGRLLDGG